VDTVTFEKFCRPALKCLITEGIDLNALRGPSASRQRASVHVVLRAPFHLTFSSLAEISDSGAEDEGFTKVPMPHSMAGKVWHALEVLAVLADPAFATTIHNSYSFQHVCDAAVVRYNPLMSIDLVCVARFCAASGAYSSLVFCMCMIHGRLANARYILVLDDKVTAPAVEILNCI
jgi:hypothetical protein